VYADFPFYLFIYLFIYMSTQDERNRIREIQISGIHFIRHSFYSIE
jgi:hypothetical protein